MFAWRERFSRFGGFGGGAGRAYAPDDGDDTSLARRMRSAAVAFEADGRSVLRLGSRDAEAIRNLHVRAEAIRACCLYGGDALDILVQDGRMMEACAAQARLDCVRELPSAGGDVRILKAVETAVGRGDVRLNRERLMLAIASFDDVQALEMAELWAVPEAVRICLSRAWICAAGECLEIARERRDAERWMAGEKIRLSGRPAAFYEHALRLTHEQEETERQKELEEQLRSEGRSAEGEVHFAHGDASLVRMRLENLLAGKRMMDALKWTECFEQLSAVESELRYDPLGTYPAMEDDSREAIRGETAAIARQLNVAEVTVARHAVSAAQAARYEGKPESMQTVCYWLYDDVGRDALAVRMGADAGRLKRRIPDASGIRCAWGIIVLAVAIYLIFMAAVQNIWLVFPGIPAAWCAATALLGRAYPKFVRPAKLLKLEINRVPDDLRTLVVMPVLLSSVKRAEEICDQMEALNCLEKDGNIRALILGDFADADVETTEDDAAIVEYVLGRIRKMNSAAGMEKYYYLHRGRRLLEADGRWMGRDRKRGALMDLNRLLLGRQGSEDAFAAEGGACASLKNAFSHVLTIDADTRFLPGSVQRMIGAIAHPLNAPRKENGVRMGYAVLQPQMEMMASACVNRFVQLFSGEGGLNTYPTSVSNFWQDMTGTGVFGGKGIYAVRPFMEALEGALPEGRILSHDMIEGTLARAALVSDVCFYDGFPASVGSLMKRFHRWTRGDWQLLPHMVSMRRMPGDDRPLDFPARVRMLDNLIRSLFAPALMGMLTTGIWMGSTPALIAGLLFAFMNAMLALPHMDSRIWKRAVAELAILPVTAAYAVDAVIRTLWRLAFTGKHLLDWVPSADAEGLQGNQALPCRIAAILLLPGLVLTGWAAPTIALALLFTVAPEWMRDLEHTPMENDAVPGQKDAAVLEELARDTWRFFERYVNEDTNDLPPDNVQVDPDAGIAGRTSPTNIGLYLMSCISAHALDLIDEDEMLCRMRRTADTLERMEKWRGHLYNWHDTGSLAPLNPRYVSSVDSGNLAAALLLCASAVDNDGEMAGRLRSLAENMDFAALYDEERDLFRIGMDVEHGRPSASHYDLMASESRILSYTAMMLGAVPVRHWKKLSRTATEVNGLTALVSWSGTMFEYLMPELFMHSTGHTLLGETVQAVILAQRNAGKEKKRPWGVSESGYYAFDMHLNYQYKAFGLRALSLGGSAPEDVAAPYASLLAAPAAPEAVARNVEQMQACGWRGECGMYEAADYLHTSADGRPRVVRSYMSHHQGMALCALCNALTDRKLVKDFMKIPQARALSLLLEERPVKGVQLDVRRRDVQRMSRPMNVQRDVRHGRPETRIADAHLLGGAGATVLVTADGAVHYERNGIQATRFGGDLINRGDGACVHLKRERSGETAILGGGRVQYEPGRAVFEREIGPLHIRMTLCVSPEDGALLKRISVSNDSDATETLRVVDCAPVSLGSAADMRAHAAFRNLFVESERPAVGALSFRRRQRLPGETGPRLLHLVSTPGSVRCETDLEKLTGRLGSTMEPGGICREMSDTTGTVLNPCSALETSVTVAPHRRLEIHFAFGLTDEDHAPAWLSHNFSEAVCERTEPLACMQASAQLGFLGMNAARHQLLQRMSAVLFDPRLHNRSENHRSDRGAVAREDLWSLGISGDLPMLTLSVHRREEMAQVREAVRIHDFYRSLGLKLDLILINEHGNDYDQPVRDAIADVIAFSPLNGMRGKPGGVYVLEGQALNERQREALRRAAVCLESGKDVYAQIRAALNGLNCSDAKIREMNPGRDCLTALGDAAGNGYGMHLADNRYVVDVLPDRVTPAPWANLMANDRFGALLTERGGGFLWANNSRSGRLTPFCNDVLNEGWGWMFYLVDEEDGSLLRLLPGRKPMMHFRVAYSPVETVYRFDTERFCGETAFCVRSDAPELRIHCTLKIRRDGNYRLVGFVDWLMGTDASDSGLLHTWTRDGACFAAGAAAGVGYFAAANARVRAGAGRNAFLGRGGIQRPGGIAENVQMQEGWVLNVPVQLREDRPVHVDWVIGWAEDPAQATARVRAFYGQSSFETVRSEACERWNGMMDRLTVETPDTNVNALANGWLIHQSLTARVRARTGLYQPGGAYGFRDQLQDMLALLPYDPKRVREHILRCAARQFEDGDVMHWWHEPFRGVRTRISDDLLFLPYVTAQYVLWTGDREILNEKIRYLKNVEIEAGKEDRYCEMQPGDECESLHGHCMRAFVRASATGAHGLCLMGSGDWNDGMNRVGAHGRGESVWLSEFLAACARDYAACAPDAGDRAWLVSLSDRMCAAVETHGWDGGWYLRAYTDAGVPLGSAGGSVCRIDAISQAWAVLSQLDESRCEQAIDAAWQMLVNEDAGLIRLLTPPFEDDSVDPGYIRGYPAGVRENGAQYTHAACWVLLALIRMGDADRAHKALQMLIPANHADTREKADVYCVEPYVLAADVYDGVHAGRGGWTWYTGSAAWLHRCILELLGFERRENRVRLNALLGDWPEAAVTVAFGRSKYRLVCRADTQAIMLDGRKVDAEWIEMQDDGLCHEAAFPPGERRRAQEYSKKTLQMQW